VASRKEEKERRRQERLERERRERERSKSRRLYSIIAAAVLVVAAVGAIALVVAAGGDETGSKGSTEGAIPPPPQKIADLEQAAKAADCKLSNPPIEGRTHTNDKIKYKTNPPTSGNHNPLPARDGVYDESPKTENLVHTLEHGRVIYQYAPGTPPRRIAQLKGLFEEDPVHAVLTPNATKMPYAVAATAWGHSIGCKRFNDKVFDAFRAFKLRYQDKAPEAVP
jgi:hypothetical protein